MARPRLTAREVKARRRRAKRLRANGHTYHEIGRRLGCTAQGAWVMVKDVSKIKAALK